MNTQEFLKTLEDKRLVNVEVLKKLHAKIDKTDKKVSAKSVAKYLIDKGYLSKFQAQQLFAGGKKPEDDLEVAVPVEQAHDTNELLKDLMPVYGATRTDQIDVDDAEPVAADYEQSIEVVDVEHEVTFPHPQSMPMQPLHTEDVLHDPLGTEFESVGYDHPGATESDMPIGFAGKKAIANQWESKWLFVGFGLLGTLIIIGVFLWYTLFKTNAEQMWADANEEFKKRRYQSAIEKFVDFVNAYPGENRAPLAKVLIANCELRIPFDSKSWDTVLERSKTVLPRLQQELEDYEAPEKFEDIRDELSVILPGTAIGFTEKAIVAPTIEEKDHLLKKALDTQEQINNAAYVPTSRLNRPGVANVMIELGDNIRIVERQIQMEVDYAAGLKEIQELTEQGQTKNAFETYDALVAKYSELRIRQPLRDAIANISKREADLVRTIDLNLAPGDELATPIKASVVVATKSGGQPIPGLSSEMLVYLANGALYGSRAVDGQIQWRKFVGNQTTMLPAWVDEPYQGDVIAADQRLHHIMRIQSSDGQVKWRIAIGEPFNEPNIDSGMVNVTTKTGKVFQLNVDDGSASLAAQIPQPAGVSAVSDGKHPYIYQVGQNSNLYVISTETMKCREVFFVGHQRDSVSVTPVVISGYIVIPENGPNYCKLHIIRPTENGLKLERPQPNKRLVGQVNAPFVKYKRWGLVMSDEGDLRMLEVNPASEDEPVTVVVEGQFSRDRQTRHYLLAEEGQLWTAGAGLRRYRIQKAAGEFDRQQIANNLDTFLGPLERIGDTLFVIRKRNASALISISAVDSTDLSEKWRTDFAAPLAGPPLSLGESLMVVSSQGDLFDVDTQTIQRGVTDQPVSRGSTIAQNLVFEQIVTVDGSGYVATSPLDRRSILSIDEKMDPPNKLSDLAPPADQPSCRPVAFGNSLLVASLRGQVIRIDPRSGRPVGAPFQPPLQPNVDVNWREPAIINDGQDFMIADSKGKFYLVAADGDKSLKKVDEYQHNGTVQSRLVLNGDQIFAVCREDLADKMIAIPVAPRIEVSKNVGLPGGYVAGPLTVDDMILVLLDTGEIVCYDQTLQQKWIAKMPEDKLVGDPQLINGEILMAFESGAILNLDAESGDKTDDHNIGQPIAFPPTQIGDRVFVAGADGTLHEIAF